MIDNPEDNYNWREDWSRSWEFAVKSLREKHLQGHPPPTDGRFYNSPPTSVLQPQQATRENMMAGAGTSMDRQIEIDAGHRVPTHGSKCANLHGHRYRIIATCSAPSLQNEHGSLQGRESNQPNEQTDMVMDFSFMKDIMVDKIDKLCDHGMILYYLDPWMLLLWNGDGPDLADMAEKFRRGDLQYHFQEGNRGSPTKLLIVPFIPTAERLAEFWYNLMWSDVREASNGHASLDRVTVFETPNCSASYPAVR